jgi:hypothetical protein
LTLPHPACTVAPTLGRADALARRKGTPQQGDIDDANPLDRGKLLQLPGRPASMRRRTQ